MVRRALLGAMGVAGSLALAPPAAAQARRPPPPAAPTTAGPRPLAQTLTGEAKAAYDAAKLLFGDGDFAGAAIKFRAAYDASRDPRLLWNIAACEKNQRHYSRAMQLVGEYLDKGRDLLTDADRREARALLEAIQSFTVKLTVVVSEPGAEVLVDDEPVGTAPLAAPVVVDLGQRRVTARKAGFQDATTQITVGGSAEAKVELKLQPEPHEARLTITTQPDARVSIDGKVVGTGSFQGTLPSGKHAIRVEADGARAYASEVTLADDENRTIEVPLEKTAAGAPAAAPATESGPSAPVFELGVSGGPGIKLHGDRPWMNAVRLDVGVRAGWVVNLGLFGEYGVIDARGVCGTDAHGASPAVPLDLSVRASFQSCTYAKAGLQLAVHFLGARSFDPWILVEPGGRLTFYDFTAFDPLPGTTTRQSMTLPALDLGGRAGLDWHPLSSFHPWSIGAWASLVYTPIASENPAVNAGNDANAPPGQHASSTGTVQYFSLLFGARSSLAF